MSIADYFEKPPERTLQPAVDAGLARRQSRQAIWLIGAILVVILAAFLVRPPADSDLRPRGTYAVGAAEAERASGHAPVNYGILPPRLDVRPHSPGEGFGDSQIAQAQSGP